MNIISSYVHVLEGRLRIKIPEVKGAPLKAREVERHLVMTPGVEEASANPTTGNVLIHFNPRLIKQEQVVSSLCELGYLEEPVARDPGKAGAAASPGNALGKVTTAVASTLFEVALTRLVTSLI